MTDNPQTDLDLQAVKQRQQAMWGSANYADVGSRILLVSELLCEAVDLQGGERVLDVACGHGNTTLAAARRFADVTGSDFQPKLLEQARARAAAEGLPAEFVEGDAEALPFDDNSFDVVLSTCGVMFAPDQQRAADELTRVCRPGGRIGMVNWTPTSWVAQLGKAVAQYAPPPAGIPSPVLWGDRSHVEHLLGDAASIRTTQRTFHFRFASAQAHTDYFATQYPPIAAALSRLDEAQAAALRDNIYQLAEHFNVSTANGLVIPLEYLEVVATKR